MTSTSEQSGCKLGKKEEGPVAPRRPKRPCDHLRAEQHREDGSCEASIKGRAREPSRYKRRESR
eukprot:2072010-Pleurochrysis_carterae.AAC.3